MNEPHPYAIVGIEVEGLFGYIDQSLRADEDNRDKITRLAILYGENGTGKTTLLRLAFHLLSPRIDRGHKSRIAITPFKSLGITLLDGTSVRATRDEARTGDYTFSVKCPGKKALTHQFEVSSDGSVGPYEFSTNLQRALLDRASTFFFLRDDRFIEIEVNDEGPEGPTPWMDDYGQLRSRARGKKIDRSEEELMLLRELREDPDLLGAALHKSIERLDRWFNVQYGQKTQSGMASSHAIYGEVIERVASASKPPKSASLTSLIKEFVKLSKESSVFELYGLSAPMNVGPIVERLKSADKQQTPTLHALLAPYVDTVKVQFTELREIYETIDTFVSQADHFMSPKRITYRVGEGLRVYSPRDQQLRPTELSSGERHLLLIRTSAVLARTHRTLFIIDEPEISLNATWQRDLAGALLAVSRDSASQFLLASHSLPLITPYRDHVLRLEQDERPD